MVVWFRYWLSDTESARAHTILVKEVPSHLREESALKAFMEGIFQQRVIDVQLVKKTKHLSESREQYEKYSMKLENCRWHLEHLKKGKKRPSTKTGFMGLVGDKVDAETYYAQQADFFKVRLFHF